MPAGRLMSSARPKILWPCRRVLFLSSAFFIHILRRYSRESPDSLLKRARFFNTQPRSLGSAGYLPRSGFETLAGSFQMGHCWTSTVIPARWSRSMSIDLTPLTDLGSGEYLGFAGGLYPDGKNSRPFAHEEAGV